MTHWKREREEGEKRIRTRRADWAGTLLPTVTAGFILLLSKENKNDLIVKIASDPEFREELYKQYGI